MAARQEIAPWAHAARRHLARVDPALRPIIKRVPPVRVVRGAKPFDALVRAIMFQQLAGAAATAILNRFIAIYGDGNFPTPAQVLKTSDAVMRRAGVSRQKMVYLKDLAAHLQNGALNFRRMARMDDEAVVAELTRVKGIGRWTAEMFLIFNLARPDVFPVDDLGVQNAVMKHYRMRKRPKRKRMIQLGERWRPYRSAATWYMWRSLGITLPNSLKSATKPAATATRGTRA
ncbi:MAG: DNA-3-methyladenine glycosylase family protein [Candidatus Binataceae bacterium]